MKHMVSRIVLIVLAIVLLLLVVFLAAVFFTGKDKIEPFLDSSGNVISGSVAEKTYIDVNGRKNGMIIRGKSEDNPVMLFISGGPGVPEYWLNEYYPNKLEDEYTVCWWDYRGEGLSYDSSINPEEITMEQLTEDAIVVCDYLKERFNVEKVYLMAHSGGTMLGLNLAIQKPEYFYCYYGMGQVSDSGYDRHEAGYYFMKEQFEKNNQKRLLKKLDSMVETKDGHIRLKSKYHDGHWEQMLLKAGCATTRDMKSDATGIFFPEMFCSCYTFSEKINFWKGKGLLSKSPYFSTSKKVYEPFEVEIPVVFLSGTYDYTTPITEVEKLCEIINAPKKELCEFKDSAHSPLWEENERVLKLLTNY